MYYRYHMSGMYGFITMIQYTVWTCVLKKWGYMLYLCYDLLCKLYATDTQVLICGSMSICLTSEFVLLFSIRDLKTAVGAWKGDGEGILPGKKGTEFTKSVFNSDFNEYLRTNKLTKQSVVLEISFYFFSTLRLYLFFGST